LTSSEIDILSAEAELIAESDLYTANQRNTLWGICNFIFQAQNGHKPNQEELYNVYYAILEKYGKAVENPITGVKHYITLTDPRMTKRDVAKLIEGALNELAMCDIPYEVLQEIGGEMKKLWKAWYNWRWNIAKEDPLFEEEQNMTWEEYKAKHPVCEITGEPGEVERVHIISKGADETIYEYPWNWFAASHRIHVLQHKKGWDFIIKLYPHIKGKIERARREYAKILHNKRQENSNSGRLAEESKDQLSLELFERNNGN